MREVTGTLPPDDTQTAEKPHVSRSIDLMIVDDEKMMIDLLVDLFSNDYKDINVKAFTISEKAVEFLEHNTVDLIITDLMMPKVSGLDLLRRARELNSEALVVLITAYGSLETTLEAIQYGAYDYLTKPFQVQEFELMVKNAIERIYLNRELKVLRAQKENLSEQNAQLQSELESMKSEMLQLKHQKEQEERVLGPRPERSGSTRNVAELSQYARASRSPREALKFELEKLDRLRREGRVSDTEYEEAKRKLLKSFFPN